MHKRNKNKDEKKSFVTFFPHFIPEGFAKDVGMIPTVLRNEYSYSSKLVCYETIKHNLTDKNIFNLDVQYICPSKYAEYLYIIKNAKKISVLNLYHMSLHTLLILNLYKIINRYGITYLKLDLDNRGMKQHLMLSGWKRKIIQFLHKRIDIITAESFTLKEMYERFVGKNVYYLPNGYYEFGCSNKDIEKENIILSVARLGTEQKATDVLLNAFALGANCHDWKLVLVGNIEKQFEEFIKKIFEKNPNLKDRIIFKGPIFDKESLFFEYKRAKIFVLSSRWEGAPLVIPEAIHNGCFLLLSDEILQSREITNNFMFGNIFEVNNCEELSDMIIKSISDTQSVDFNKIIDFSKQYEWNKVLAELDRIICDVEKKMLCNKKG